MFLQGRNHTLHKDVFVTCRRHGTPDRFPWCNPFKEKWAKNKGACESTPHGQILKIQWPLMHYKWFSWTPYLTVLHIHCTFQCKVCLVRPQNILWPYVMHLHSCQKLKGKIKMLLWIMGFQLLDNLNLVGYLCKMQRKIFLTVDHGTPNSCDTTCALDAEFGVHSTRSATATATLSTTSIGMDHLPIPGATLKSPVFSNFTIFFFNPFVDMGPLLSPFIWRNSLDADLLLLPFW